MLKNQIAQSILLVDDDRLILTTLTSDLERAGYIVNTTESVDEAESWLESNKRPDLVVLDMRMPNRNGLELIPRLKELNQIPFILLTAYSEQELVEQAASSGAVGYLVKPVELAQLLPAVETALANAKSLQNLRGEKQHLQSALDSDRSISVATGIIMEQHKINQHEALELLPQKCP
jgi:Response regulator containing CheY-like receiver, AAA-type ATPase, and DNA-binding domains